MFLNKVYKAGDIASQIDQLYDKKLRGHKKSVIVGMGNVSVDIAINLQEERFKDILEEIQKGYKTSGVEK